MHVDLYKFTSIYCTSNFNFDVDKAVVISSGARPSLGESIFERGAVMKRAFFPGRGTPLWALPQLGVDLYLT